MKSQTSATNCCDSNLYFFKCVRENFTQTFISCLFLYPVQHICTSDVVRISHVSRVSSRYGNLFKSLTIVYFMEIYLVQIVWCHMHASNMHRVTFLAKRLDWSGFFSLLFSFEIIEIVRGWYNQDCRCFEELHTTDVWFSWKKCTKNVHFGVLACL